MMNSQIQAAVLLQVLLRARNPPQGRSEDRRQRPHARTRYRGSPHRTEAVRSSGVPPQIAPLAPSQLDSATHSAVLWRQQIEKSVLAQGLVVSQLPISMQ